jgi:hypothetical protein
MQNRMRMRGTGGGAMRDSDVEGIEIEVSDGIGHG